MHLCLGQIGAGREHLSECHFVDVFMDGAVPSAIGHGAQPLQ